MSERHYIKGWRAQGDGIAQGGRRPKPVEIRGEGVFDEVVAGTWLHIELMSYERGHADYFVNIGSRRMNVRVYRDGHVCATFNSDDSDRDEWRGFPDGLKPKHEHRYVTDDDGCVHPCFCGKAWPGGATRAK